MESGNKAELPHDEEDPGWTSFFANVDMGDTCEGLDAILDALGPLGLLEEQEGNALSHPSGRDTPSFPPSWCSSTVVCTPIPIDGAATPTAVATDGTAKTKDPTSEREISGTAVARVRSAEEQRRSIMEEEDVYDGAVADALVGLAHQRWDDEPSTRYYVRLHDALLVQTRDGWVVLHCARRGMWEGRLLSPEELRREIVGDIRDMSRAELFLSRGAPPPSQSPTPSSRIGADHAAGGSRTLCPGVEDAVLQHSVGIESTWACVAACAYLSPLKGSPGVAASLLERRQGECGTDAFALHYLYERIDAIARRSVGDERMLRIFEGWRDALAVTCPEPRPESRGRDASFVTIPLDRARRSGASPARGCGAARGSAHLAPDVHEATSGGTVSASGPPSSVESQTSMDLTRRAAKTGSHRALAKSLGTHGRSKGEGRGGETPGEAVLDDVEACKVAARVMRMVLPRLKTPKARIDVMMMLLNGEGIQDQPEATGPNK